MTDDFLIQQLDGLLLHSIARLHPEQIVPEAELVRDLGADSLDLVNLVFGVEEMFGIQIADGEAEQLKTVADVRACVIKKVRSIAL